MCVRRLLAITDVVLMPCGCRAVACSSVRLLPVCLSPRFLDTNGGEGERDVVGACFIRISSAMREFCGSRYLRLPGLLCHGILSLCRRGRMSTVAAHRNSLACFSIPIFRSDFCLLPVFDAYSGLGHFQSFHARCSWDRSFRRAPPRPPA